MGHFFLKKLYILYSGLDSNAYGVWNILFQLVGTLPGRPVNKEIHGKIVERIQVDRIKIIEHQFGQKIRSSLPQIYYSRFAQESHT